MLDIYSLNLHLGYSVTALQPAAFQTAAERMSLVSASKVICFVVLLAHGAATAAAACDPLPSLTALCDEISQACSLPAKMDSCTDVSQPPRGSPRAIHSLHEKVSRPGCCLWLKIASIWRLSCMCPFSWPVLKFLLPTSG